MSDQLEAIKRAVALLPRLSEKSPIWEHLWFQERDVICAALTALKPVAEGTHVIVPKVNEISDKDYFAMITAGKE